eukprot:TRINITY_DN77722_c0_g1_i1.p1 TRINITY_DN77722_c0_g1~~TRINITY_DN77722_c0_g1_i1.p1  ORF type:complete len:119 (-),score=4.00 TRINITY_DN77722_c0_g1_i1:110-466(-)
METKSTIRYRQAFALGVVLKTEFQHKRAQTRVFVAMDWWSFYKADTEFYKTFSALSQLPSCPFINRHRSRYIRWLVRIQESAIAHPLQRRVSSAHNAVAYLPRPGIPISFGSWSSSWE